MDPRPVNCRWPDCADYDDRCAVGINIPCIVIEGEGLERERHAANRGCAFTPVQSFWIILATLAAIAAVIGAM